VKSKLFSVTRDDCDWQTFASGGPGGQHQNKTQSGVRCIHRASGAVGECRESRHQHQNRVVAFKRMALTEKFQSWARLEAMRRMGQKSVDEIVDELMQEQNLKIEYLEAVPPAKEKP